MHGQNQRYKCVSTLMPFSPRFVESPLIICSQKKVFSLTHCASSQTYSVLRIHQARFPPPSRVPLVCLRWRCAGSFPQQRLVIEPTYPSILFEVNCSEVVHKLIWKFRMGSLISIENIIISTAERWACNHEFTGTINCRGLGHTLRNHVI